MVIALAITAWVAAYGQEAPTPEAPAADAPPVEAPAEPTAPAEPEAPDEPADPAPDVGYEVDVYGQQRIIAARQQVINELREAGYEREIDKGDAIVMRHVDPWRGDVYLYRDGWAKIRRQPIRFEAPPSGPWWCVLIYPCVRVGDQVVSRTRMQWYKHEVSEVMNDDISVWTSTIADVAVEERLRGLPDQLEALWRDGTPLDPNERTLTTHEERRQALLRYWETRTDTPWGEAVRAAVEAFSRAVVQGSEHPFTDEEIARFNAKSTAGRPFSLRRPVPVEEAPAEAPDGDLGAP